MEKGHLSPLRRFWLLLRPDKSEIRNIYVYAIFIGLINLSLPIGIQAIVNLIQGGSISTSWIVLIVFVISGIVIAGILQIRQLQISEQLQQKLFTRAAFEFAYRVPRIRLDKLRKYYAPELMNRFFDIVSVQKALPKVLIDFSASVIQVMFGLILLSLYHPFFIVFSLFMVLVVMLILRLTVRRGLQTSLEESKHKYRVAHWLQELARANYTFKLAGKTELPLHVVDQASGSYIASRESHFRVLITQYGLMIVFKALIVLGLLAIGGILVIDQQMNIGQFVASEIIILLIVNSVEKLMLSFEVIYDMLTAIEKIAQVTDLELESDSGFHVDTSDKGMELTMHNVNFVYQEEDRAVLKDIHLTIQSGERILITGPNDSGKSTLLYLLGGLFLPTRGSITMDGVPVRNYCPESLRSRIGGYLRDEVLFEGTLLENITLGREAATFDLVRWAVESLGLTTLVNELPHGYETRIHPHGRQFSKSTVAKILIARSIADKPRLLLLENSFSVFPEDERRNILDFLMRPEHGWTVLLTSSLPVQVMGMTYREVVLDKGKIVEIKEKSC